VVDDSHITAVTKWSTPGTGTVTVSNVAGSSLANAPYTNFAYLGQPPVHMTVMSRPSVEDAFAQGTDGALYWKMANMGTGETGTWQSLGGSITSAPAVISRAPYDGSTWDDIYVRGGDGAI